MTSELFAQRLAQAQAFWKAVANHKWQVVVGTLAMMLALNLIIARLPKEYEATTTILVDPQQIPEKYVSAAITTDAYSRLNTITQQVLSRTRLQQIIDRLNLYPERRASASAEELIEKMRDDITIQVKQGSGPELSTFTISYKGKQPILVAQVANELAASFIQWNVASREQQVVGTKEFLSSELADAKRSLETQEDELRRFKMSHLGETPDQAANNLQALAGLQSTLQVNAAALSRLDEEKALMTTLPESADNAKVNPNLTERGRLELERRQLEEELQRLRVRYFDSYPDVVTTNRRLGEVNSQLESLPPDIVGHKPGDNGRPSVASVRLELLDKEMERLKAQQDQIQTQIQEYQAKLDAAPLREQQLIELTRNYDISKQNYQALMNKSFSIDMAADLEQKQKGERFTVLDLAVVPEKPVSPRRNVLIPMSGVVALGFSLFVVLATETLSPAIQTEKELKSLLPVGVHLKALIPRIEIAADKLRDQRITIYASVVSIALCLALLGVIWQIGFAL